MAVRSTDQILLPHDLIAKIGACRLESESQGIEHGFNLYLRGSTLVLGGRGTGKKTTVN